jgi:hypothetical protein
MQSSTTEFSVPAKWDRAGIAGSFICIFHCVATPFLAAAVPVLAVTEKETHIGLTLMLMLIGLLAFLPGYRRHNKPYMALVAGLGFAMLILAVFVPERFATEAMETGLTVVGGLLLITAHLTNAYFCRHCPVCAEDVHAASAPARVSPGPVPASRCGRRLTGGDGHAVSEETCCAGSDRLSPDLRHPKP